MKYYIFCKADKKLTVYKDQEDRYSCCKLGLMAKKLKIWVESAESTKRMSISLRFSFGLSKFACPVDLLTREIYDESNFLH